MGQTSSTATPHGTIVRWIAAVSAILYSGFTFAASLVGADPSYRISLWVSWAVVMAAAIATYSIGAAMQRSSPAPAADVHDRAPILTPVG